MTVEIVSFRPELAADFSRLNRDWIDRLFVMEAADHKLLDDPERQIISQGGMIFFALEGTTVLGTCAALRLDAGRFELAKMGVTPAAQGRGLGRLLGQAAIAFAAERGARQIELLTNSSLAPAITLYEKLGFEHRAMPATSDYVRSDVYMV
ncbi:MAG: GNAT family N-acetyltransferase, partial [Gemmatimonadota bacterium]